MARTTSREGRRYRLGAPNCPICLAATSLIDTPAGPVPVPEVRPGLIVWTLEERGARVAAPVLEVGSMDAPAGHEVVRVRLELGRTITASPGHPLADGRLVGDLRSGDHVGGILVLTTERLPYVGRAYDLRPAGPTATYFVDGVALATTIGAAYTQPPWAR